MASYAMHHAPLHPDKSQLIQERAWLQGSIISIAAYGTNVALFILTFNWLRSRSRLDWEKNKFHSKQIAILQAYTGVVFVLCTLSAVAQADMTQLAFVDHHDFEGGPNAYERAKFSSPPVGAMGVVSFSLTNFLLDCLLLWRCSVIYRNSNTSLWYILACPGIAVLASCAAGVVFLDRITDGISSPFNHYTLTLVYAGICLGLNMVLTFMIIVRLSLYRIRIMKLVGSQYAEQYTSILSILIESAFIIDISILVALVLFVTYNPFVTVPLLSLVQVEGIASFMIIFRVARGTAWSAGTANQLIVQQGGLPVEDGIIESGRFRITSQMTQTSTAVHFTHNTPTIGACAAALRDSRNFNRKAGDAECACPWEVENAERVED
ncbi:hypothetical protein GALMADRAFT_229452 [Galerina marginata CBS 339.88]|uniref:Uncharacterized protein n=1 Tax=Galerina marginata (strain CBS 339.88) TaxID=685588 RepID=A0A067SKS2_GALM3|nr:hypothetical protein GALMADRAFT_229452 [Galerina marginata CBS 339.88]